MLFFGVCKRADLSPLGIGILEDGEADVADGDVLLSAEGVGTGEDRDRGRSGRAGPQNISQRSRIPCAWRLQIASSSGEG